MEHRQLAKPVTYRQALDTLRDDGVQQDGADLLAAVVQRHLQVAAGEFAASSFAHVDCRPHQFPDQLALRLDFVAREGSGKWSSPTLLGGHPPSASLLGTQSRLP